MSKRYFLASRFINQLLRFVDAFNKVGIRERPFGHDVDFPVKKFSKLVEKGEVVLGVFFNGQVISK